MQNRSLVFAVSVIAAVIWFIITWSYISLEVYDVRLLEEWAYKVLHFREKFIELALLIWMFAFWFYLWSYFFGGETREWTEDEIDRWGFIPQKWGRDNLEIIEWIGPKIHEILYENDIKTFGNLKNASPKELKLILQKAWKKFALANPKSWPKQATFAHKWKWKELKEYQDSL